MKTSFRRLTRAQGPVADPFGERSPHVKHLQLQLLGARFRFESASSALLGLVKHAFADLPPHRFDSSPRLLVRLQSSKEIDRAPRKLPPARLYGGAGLLCGIMDAANGAYISPAAGAALVTVSPAMLRDAYRARYELLEFAAFTLASRAQGLVSLHGACVGLRGRGVLLLGTSGAGKSTLTLHCLLQGMEFLAEDSVHLLPERLLLTGVPNFLHLRRDAPRWVEDAAHLAWIRESPTILRRSGVRKYEVDMRTSQFRLSRKPLELAAVVFISPQSENATQGPVLTQLSRTDCFARLEATQPYAAQHPQWLAFKQKAFATGVYELRRGPSPAAAAAIIRRLVER